MVESLNPIIYGAGESSFTSNGLGRLSEAILCQVTEELNGIYEAEVQVPLLDPYFSEIQQQRIIYCMTDNGKQPFEIYKISRPLDGVVTINLQHLSYRLAKMTALPLTATSCEDAMEKLIAYANDGATWSVWTDKDISKSWTLKNPRSIRNCLGGEQGSVLQLFGGEYEWDHRTVKLHTHRGADNNVWIRYGKNLTELLDEDDETTVYTSVLPFVIIQSTTEGGEETVIVGDKIATGMEYSDPAYEMVVPLDLSNEFQVEPSVEDGEEPELPTKEEINARAETYMVANTPWISKKSLTVSFAPLWETEEYKDVAPLEAVHLGDTVHVLYSALGVSQAMKVIRIVYDSLRERVVEVELGDKRSTLGNLINDTAQAAAEAAVSVVNGKLVAVEAQFGRVSAMEAYIGDLVANNIDANYIKANRADIVTLTADTAEIRQLVAAQATISEAIIGRVSANEANISSLQSGKADIGDLQAAVADITSLDSDVANIKTIMAGNVGTGTLQTITLNSANTQLDTALIRTLIANNITVNDLKAADLDVDRIGISGEAITISGRTIQIRDDNDVVRVQIGLDANDEFTFTLFDATGQGVLIDAEGIHEDAVPDGLIVDDMVANNANIAGSKLDIDSVVTAINGSTENISSTKIWFDNENRSLNALFADMQTDVGDLTTTVASQTTAIEAAQGKLSALITDDELTRLNTRAGLVVSQGLLTVSQGNIITGSTAVQRMENNYLQTEIEIDGIRTSMGSMETEINGNIETVRSQVAEYKQTLDEFSTYIGETYVTTEHAEEMLDDRLVDYVTTTDMSSAIEQSASSITSTVTSLVETTVQDAVDAETAKNIGVFSATRVVQSDTTITYTAQVIRGNEDVTQTYPAYCFDWYTIDGNNNDEVFLVSGYSCSVAPSMFEWGGTVVGVFTVYEDKALVTSSGQLAFSQGTLNIATY